MNRSFTVLTALLCSVSFIPLATASPGAALTDWHVAPVLASGKNSSPYCAMATNYPSAGIIITHARNKHGTGTVAFDFKNAAFEPHQFYGLDIGFGAAPQEFAAEAKNEHLLVIELRNDHPLYAALDAGKNIDINVRDGGPHVTVAGNSRAFFQLNYCVQALNDEVAPPVLASATTNTQPSFGLQQPAPTTLAPEKTVPAVQVDMDVLTYAAPDYSTGYKTPVLQRAFKNVAQANTTQTDANTPRDELGKMLDEARSEKPTTPKRQKLSGISSNDVLETNTAAPVNNPSRQSLLYDDPSAVNSYTAPRLSDVDPTYADQSPSMQAKKPVTAAKLATAKDKINVPPVVAGAKPIMVPSQPVAAPVVATAAKASAPALPPPVDSLSDLDEKPAAIAAKPKNTSLNTETKTVTVPKPVMPASTLPAPAATAVIADKAPVTPAPIAPAPPVNIVWDEPVAPTPAAPTVISTPVANVPTLPTTPVALGAPEHQALLSDKPVAPPVNAEVKNILADSAPSSATIKTVGPDKLIKSPLKPNDVMAKAVKPVTPPAMAPVMPAPALPPALVEETVMDKTVRGPMKRANEAISMDFPEEDDSNNDVPDVAIASNTITSKPLATPDGLMQKNNFELGLPFNFKPPAAKSAGSWEAKNITPKTGAAYCILQSRFVNQQNLFLSRSADGNTTLGLDYGMDLLQLNRDYKATVQVDNLFTEDFIGQARQANLLVVQMGRKDSLFQAASEAKALHIEMPGGASTFDVTGLNSQMNAFNQCLVAQGGQAIHLNNDETVLNAMAPQPMPMPVPMPIAPAPVIAAPVVAAPVAAPLAPPATAPLPAPSAQALSAPAVPPQESSKTLRLSPTQVSDVLQKANIPASVRSGAAGYEWGSRLDVIKGEMSERSFLVDKADLLEAVMRDIDGQEQSCTTAKFTSEVGAPEQHGTAESVVAESSCTAATGTVITASLYQRIGQLFRVWTQKGPDSAHDLLIRQRDRLAAVLETNNSVATGTSDKPRS